ncbi:uncharacterized protein LOC143860591 [Tasmannia lanceolata]|uniref:uncharacterized protein LOC143860591 n=1 Tax=Tasmannia lanceolata TaxID=3420 RepID=UPI004062EF96
MPEKGSLPVSNSHIFRPNSWLPKVLPTITALLFLAMVLIWSIDGCTIRDGIQSWRKRRTNVGLTFNSSHNRNLTNLSSPPHPNLTHPPPPPADRNLTCSPPPPHRNLTHTSTWLSVKLDPSFTSNLISRWLTPGGQLCRDSRTTNISISGLDSRSSVELPAGETHQFLITALDSAGSPRCSGGDYFETDISGILWKSRPPVKDLGNGSYSLSLQVHPEFAGEYKLTVVLLFRSFEGLKFSPERFVFRRDLRKIPIKFYKTTTQFPELRICRKSDFTEDIWSGRWTRHGKNDNCQIDDDGRFRCLNPNFPCKKPWCEGSLGSLESNGWVYSAHCSFKIFSLESAWDCLQNRWLFFWGDSNHVDTIRNLLNFVLGLPDIKSVPRRFDTNFTNPNNPSQTVRITSIFNGHWNDTMNYQGLNSLKNEGFRELLKGYFSGEKVLPDMMIMNSGLHDGVYWQSIRRFSEGAAYAARFWSEIVESIRRRNQTVPELFYRTTVAAGGYARNLAFNPNKMEAFNLVVLDKFREKGLVSGVIDDFDMTFPWHFDNRCSDGVHYGRGPAKMKWRDGEIGHQYFVDLMLGQVLLNAICAAT